MLIIGNGKVTRLTGKPGMSLLSQLREAGISIAADCGGNGTCGKCRVTVSGKGEVLACAYFPEGNETILLPASGEEQMKILTSVPISGEFCADETREDFLAAVDLGTTTVALELLGIKTGKIYASHAFVNPQRAYGADVISRIRAACEGKAERLKDLIRRELRQGLNKLAADTGINPERIIKVAVAGNTVMEHIFLGLSCDGLGQYPFTPVTLNECNLEEDEVRRDFGLTAEMVTLPGFSAFVGGDIAAGLLTCGFLDSEKPSLFLDLGTNGEMALGDRNTLLLTSAAAGPAFEGGNISCGTGSIPGAICGVDIKDGIAVCATIGDKTACGLCGTGLVEAVSELRKNRILDETGLLKSEYFDMGYPLARGPGGGIRLLQQDIREFQMAKAAVRAGMEVLLKKYGCKWDDLGHIYVAGGFGFYLNMEKAAGTGLFPEEAVSKIRVMGNSALTGAALYGCKDLKERIDKKKRIAKEVVLANENDFQTLYLESMYL
ncbi:ASKHA domain-containing protein [Anaerolentibacter hominis]|uniref:ASKHA domain-containing protein n=1 Tax=Anaerolentibacter hominis TaxID=3079009 RepID=UPI0031B885CF